MFTYTFEATEDIKILTSFDMRQVKKEITEYADHTCCISTYPNGFILEMIEYPNKIILNSNRELVENGDGTLDVLL